MLEVSYPTDTDGIIDPDSSGLTQALRPMLVLSLELSLKAPV